MSGATNVASATLSVVEPYSIRVTIRPSNVLVHGEVFVIHCVVFDEDGHAITAGQEMLIRLSVDGEANVDLIKSTENGTITDAIAQNAGDFTVTARLYSIAGRTTSKKVCIIKDIWNYIVIDKAFNVYCHAWLKGLN